MSSQSPDANEDMSTHAMGDTVGDKPIQAAVEAEEDKGKAATTSEEETALPQQQESNSSAEGGEANAQPGSSPGVNLTLAFQLEDCVVWAVNTHTWHSIVPPLIVNEDNFRQHPVTEWSTSAKTFSLRSSADQRVIYVMHTDGSGSSSCRAIAIEIRMPNLDVSRDLNAALQLAMDAFIEFEADVGRAIRTGVLNPAEDASIPKPTLGQLLNTLLSPGILTPEQRDQINNVTFSFLQHELSLSRAYAHIAQIVGLSTVRAVLKNISAEMQKATRPPGIPVAQEGGVVTLEGTRPVSVSNGIATPATPIMAASGFPPPAYFFKTPLDQKSFFAFNESQNYLQGISKQHTCPFWIELPEHDELPDRYAHHVMDNGGVWLVLGGLMRDKTFSFVGREGAWLNGFEYLTIINQLDFKSTTQPLLGTPPEGIRHGGVCLLVGDFSALDVESDCVVVFGGNADVSFLSGSNRSSPATAAPSSDMFVLDLQNLRWLRFPRDKDGENTAWPSARAYAASGVVLRDVNDDGDACEIAGFFVAGGLGPGGQGLGDMWYFDFTRGTWTELATQLPSPRWGSAVSVAGLNCHLMHGGYNLSGQPLSDILSIEFELGEIPSAVVTQLEIVSHPLSMAEGDSSNSKSENEARLFARALHTAFLVNVSQRSIKPYELGMRLVPTTADTKATLLLCGGNSLTSKFELTLVDVYVNPQGQVTRASLTSNVEPQLRPFTSETQMPPLRCLETICFFSCFSPNPTTRPKPGCPSLFIHGGSIKSDSNAGSALCGTENSWIVSLHSVDPFELNWFSTSQKQSEETGSRKRTASKMLEETSSSTWKGRLPDLEDEGVLRYLKRSNNGLGTKDSLEVCRLFAEHLRHNAAWMCGINFTPGVFQSLGSLVKWPFSPIGNLMENSAALSTRATHISVEIGVATNSGVSYVAFQDNGRGLPFSTLNRALKRFGNWDGPVEKRDLIKGHPVLQYGMGLKFAFSRLSQSVLVISRTRGTIGVALFSQSLLFHADSQTVTCPACFWRLPSKDTVFPEAEHWKHQQKIQQFSPFRTAAALAEQINALGARPGTRFLFFDFKHVYPLSLSLDPQDITLRLSSAPSREIYTQAGICPPSSSYRQPQQGLVPLSTKFDVSQLDNSKEIEVLPVTCGDATVPVVLSANGYKNTTTFIMVPPGSPSKLADDSAFSSFEKDSLFDNIQHYVEAKSTTSNTDESPPNLPVSDFPCWTNARDSLDYSLPTYLYWSMLFCASTIWHSGCPLVPIRRKASTHPTEQKLSSSETPSSRDPFKRSLWRYLKANLHAMVELDYLFHPEDAHAESFGLIGFLNPLDKLIETDDRTSGAPVDRVYEAGVLLYYKERLVKRMFVPLPAPAELLDRFGRGLYPRSHFAGSPIFMFPCTAVIHVPDWLYPTASREDFVAERSPVFDDFSYKLKNLIAQYLSVCLDDEARKQWSLARGEALLQESGRTRPLSPMLHMALLKSLHTSTAANS
eukprot:Gregarina_sp_Poly_1__1302@NODE_131_length_13241_cov_228_075983_g117_i0_p1_GENE_NODE_131_length_13241_cov_228_075983_g117_i0NODE_131_length_13241_cov_228_075983_g117_i0_p1_ORF_typecomplete_len1483_score216_91Kelch_3/PF13415_6/5_5e02Kelch_3/PF13415_6/0_00069Kelch_3/PF13415_6/2_7e07Kelch_3/PF13415_6/1_2e04Kelch_4/PF13418_6/6_7e02Kelch_4/PF13418_6/0_46Kelch_4/PF13418_6/1_9e05Kelch_4/PF13418_6/4_6Kelch_4/PF13418_6/1_4e04Kelch_4/PF13418_6/7_9e03HATPase_c_3/PF13589_6/2_1e07Kelch_6/PF13964_6/7_5e03Kelch